MDLSAFVDLAGAAATGILFLLIALSVVQVAILVERGLVMWRTRAQRRQLRRLTHAITAGRLEEAATLVETPRSLPETVLAAGLARAADGPAAVEEVVRARTAAGRLALERRLSFLATLGNNAPFIGLLGTVLGIMHAFANLSMAGGQVSAEVMSGISEALVATGVGLMVALPAVIAFNWFQRVIKGRVVAAESLGGELLALLRARETHASQAVSFDRAA
ncbi:MAG TPA: MotA/TolQ/ExbB proton channel family protein [Kofleriaceae bacterium]|nr:MotA/TolQ/ExbB proton channel family protein [Kofleriaceae bacterium]